MSEPLSSMRPVAKIAAWLQRFEEWLLAFLVLILVILAGAQIFLRNIFGGGISWADPFLRTLVVWTAMLGALAAVRDDKHIAVDVLQRFLPAGAQRIARIVTLLFTAAICAAMAWYSIGLVSIDFAESSSAAAAGAIKAIPSWVLESILPIGFALMALRFVLRAFAAPAHPPELLHDPGAPSAKDEQP
ncbi:MAG TPA: TRAP transporter small permease [Rudaea sp.]|jgi:TRAP-type C4-dicarboxylate transport system permease small subunit|uniref:TRAP transporter small permease n=1 Tax=Rudaea sp. TaxID=2136325 RepID=UPI002F92D75B